ncbi:protein FAM156A/FAM156B [Callithrix jacchus]|uniref:protein FAM156A/FAM156B n=1 Tax=Callithrix jacchus TaxID=9483 RepID=UPI0004F0AFD3|nr:protein FAM156A/FAM156B [Callithrix jacchus]XP_008987574.1 protein FAM156A/FAM156B [Callithrix jacchus]XP_017823992.1 protein FAM156A/FAM156B [Callithrix jacchus]XP_017823994.1 protein FAM156A/FAM156B [Callithrix jacchus]XP_035145464.1 protein FAM156A/FAM156B [Callithrix jacchus]XP_035145465.1 protein FAM156A/FAM156B [Callithrix jacchus]XP_035145466.1 protein FAM156A/FAM156B [Callithrix jacchus]XP_035145467.1 protein FAM156A/FAM156B [Callithrix jacchus]XP_035145468.1 protein FAM156A/FAM1
MDPLQKQNPASPSTSFPMTAAETSREGPAPSQPSYSEQLMMGLSNLSPGPGLSNLNLGPGPSNLSPGPSHSAPLPEGLLHERYREEKTLEEQRWERLEFLQRKKAFLRHVRRRHRDHMAPYAVGREARISPLGDRGQNRFRCECRYCQSHRPNLSGIPGERNRAPLPSSWETLVQGLSGLTLNLGTNQPGPLPEAALQPQEAEEKRQRERQQESKIMFQRLLKQWLEEN